MNCKNERKHLIGHAKFGNQSEKLACFNVYAFALDMHSDNEVRGTSPNEESKQRLSLSRIAKYPQDVFDVKMKRPD